MAKYYDKVLLGFEDEIVTEKNKHLVNLQTNKIGGKPDLPSNIIWETPKCALCQLPKPLVVQVYAPLFENSSFHRTLYVFACINPKCYNRSESWSCFRVQTRIASEQTTQSQTVSKINAMNWCNDADNWGDDNNSNDNEENGNVINSERTSDDESYSYDDSVRSVFENLSVDDRNANTGAQGGAVGEQNSPGASAEIEGDEEEVITIDSPVMPQNDLRKLLSETVPLPSEMSNAFSNSKRCPSPYFSAFFMSVGSETDSFCNDLNDKHVEELLTDYKRNNTNFDDDMDSDDRDGEKKPKDKRKMEDKRCEGEKYEKTKPPHGDQFSYVFFKRVSQNPGQILRYSRELEPLLLYPQPEVQQYKKCPYCQEARTFEFQILSTIIPRLRLATDQKQCSRLDFGTALIYTCLNSCWSSDDDVREEMVIIQTERC